MADKKLLALDGLDLIVKALDERNKGLINSESDRAIAQENALLDNINSVREMFGGKSIRYVTKAEYDELTEAELNNDTIVYFITDVTDVSHEHVNKQFLDSLNQEVLDAKQNKEDQNLATEDKTIIGAINELLAGVNTIFAWAGNGDLLLTDAKDTIVNVVNELQTEINELQVSSEELDNDIFTVTAKAIELDIKKLNKEDFDNLNLDTVNDDIFDLQAKAIELETYKADKEYVDEKLSTMDAITLNGYSLWVGTTKELEQIEEKDSNTLYFEIEENENKIVTVTPVDNKITLTLDKYQKANALNNAEIILPEVTDFTELHLFFDRDMSNDEMSIILPDNCRWRVDSNLQSSTSFELIAIYNTVHWFVNIVAYSDDIAVPF